MHVQWVGDAIQASHPLSSPSPPVSKLSSIRVFSNEPALHIRRPKDWSFSISPSNEYSGLIFFKIEWPDLLAAQGALVGFSSGKEYDFNAADMGLIPESRWSPGKANGYPLQYYCLENLMDRGAWWATDHGVTKIQTFRDIQGDKSLTTVYRNWIWNEPFKIGSVANKEYPIFGKMPTSLHRTAQKWMKLIWEVKSQPRHKLGMKRPLWILRT